MRVSCTYTAYGLVIRPVKREWICLAKLPLLAVHDACVKTEQTAKLYWYLPYT